MDHRMNPSAQILAQPSTAQQLQELLRVAQQMRTNPTQLQLMTQQVTLALNKASQNNTARQQRLQAQGYVQVPLVKLKSPSPTK